MASEANLNSMFTVSIKRFSDDHWQIKAVLAQACAYLFTAAADQDQRQILDPYWMTLMQSMFKVQTESGALSSGELLSFTGSMCICIELCNQT